MSALERDIKSKKVHKENITLAVHPQKGSSQSQKAKNQ